MKNEFEERISELEDEVRELRNALAIEGIHLPVKAYVSRYLKNPDGSPFMYNPPPITCEIKIDWDN